VAKKTFARGLLSKILAGSRNVSFDEFRLLVEGFGFRLSRVRGSHPVFTHPKVKELVNLQNVKGQVMELVERYSLTLEDER